MADSRDLPETLFDYMVAGWPDRATVRVVLEAVRRADAERAVRPLAVAVPGPPVVNVTVTGLPGHFRGVAGTGEVAYLPGPAPEPSP